jgi:hypothetical protein
MKKMVVFCVICLLAVPLFSQNQTQNAMSVLNYLFSETYAIQEGRYNRMELERIFNSLLNDLRDRAIDERTQLFMNGLFSNISQLRLLTFQREQAKYIYENQRSQAITKAMPNPLYLLGTVSRGATNPYALIASLAGMALDSAAKYASAVNESNMSYLMENWDLDVTERATLENLSISIWNYKLDLGRRNNFDDTLNENSIKKFVADSREPDLYVKRQLLEGKRSLYAQYAPYWLELAKVYYEIADRTGYDVSLYRLCLDAIQQYKTVQAPIFRKDYNFARVLPLGIVAAGRVYGTTPDYTRIVSPYLQEIVENTDNSDYTLRWFAAENYIYLASLDSKNANLEKAYDIIVNNIAFLVQEARSLLDTYMADNEVPGSLTNALKEAQDKIEEAEYAVERYWMDTMKKAPSSREVRRAKQEDKACNQARDEMAKIQYQIDEYKKYRARELPPLHAGLYLNYRTFLALSQELGKSREELQLVNGMVDSVFAYLAMRSGYLGERIASVTTGAITHTGRFPFLQSEEILAFSNFPVICLMPGSEISVRVTEMENGSERIAYEEENIKYTPGNVDRSTSRLAACSVFNRTGGMSVRQPAYTTKLELKPTGKIQVADRNEVYIDLTIQTEDLSLALRFTKPARTGFSRGINPVGMGR